MGGLLRRIPLTLGHEDGFLEMWNLATFLCETNWKKGLENATGEVFADHNLHHRILIIQHL
jgi:hypothetical protein